MTQRDEKMPRWLLEHLQVTHGLGTDGVGRIARPRRCDRCHVPTWRGLDSRVAALARECDLMPVGELGEVLALLAGRKTFDLLGSWGSYEIAGPRGPERIAAGNRRYPIVVSHRCGAAPLSSVGARMLDRPTQGAGPHDACPF